MKYNRSYIFVRTNIKFEWVDVILPKQRQEEKNNKMDKLEEALLLFLVELIKDLCYIYEMLPPLVPVARLLNQQYFETFFVMIYT